MRAYIRDIVAKEARALFQEADAETVLSWWIANEGRKPVVVVGSGFTRNAVYKATGAPVRAQDAPLWGEISKALADDLRIEDASSVDPLALAEFHRHGLGERHFYDMLRDLLPDDALAPGEAHRALFNFDFEAIVTTNFLDTLLDRDARCVPIFDDRDLARRIEKPGKIEVLYFHGHRSSPSTWVASRSQYEDLPRKIPMILARVRQLLSQHPVITVGFSMTDPDFHQIYRQISLDMQVTNPAGLSLLGPASPAERTSEQESAQRRYWERLGIRIARFNSWDGFSGRLVRFFSMANPIEVEELKDIVGDPKRPFSERVVIAKSAFEDPNVERYVETYRGWENAVWRICIDREFELSEHEEVEQKIRQHNDALFGGPSEDNEVRVSIGGGGRSRAPDKEPTFKATCFEERRIRKDWELAWLADRWLETRRSTAERFAAWLFYRVEHEYWDQRRSLHGDADIDIATLLGAVWRAIDERADAASGYPHRTQAVRQLQIAYRFLKKYGANEEAEQVEVDILALGGRVEPSNEAPPEPPRMKAAFGHMMNGEYRMAAEAYDKALEEAKRKNNAFLVWLAAAGRHDAYGRAIDSRDHHVKKSDKERALEKEYTRAARKYACVTEVKRWKDEAERRITELRKDTIETLQSAARGRKFERRGWSFTDTPHFAWRAFRDLETADAPPGIQERYLQPLLDYDSFKVDEALTLRLRFGIKKTKEWLDEKLDEREDSIESASERDRALVKAWHNAWKDEDVTKTTLVACIETMKPLLDVLEVGDALLPIELLQKARQLGQVVVNHRGWHVIGGDLAKAWRDVAYILRDKASLEAFRAFAEKPNDGRAEDELDRRMGQLPWYAWMILGVASPDELVRWLCVDIGQRQRPSGSAYDTIEGVGAALFNIVWNADVAPLGVSAISWDLVARWCTSALERGKRHDHDIDWMTSILNLITMRAKQTGERGSDEVWQQVEEKSYDQLRATWRGLSAEADKGINVSLAVSILLCLAIIMERPDNSKWAEFVEEAWQKVVANWDAFHDFLEHNPFWLPKLGWFLATIIEHDFGGHRAEAGERLLELWSLSSSVHHAVPRILERKYWTDDAWSRVLDKLRQGLGGARGEFSASWRMAISSLLRQAALHREGGLSPDLQFLVEHVALLVANEEAIVANHAAYTAIYCAESCTDDQVDRVALLDRTLDAMASDTRLAVRQAAAYAGGRLPITAKSQKIIESAKRIQEKLAEEKYLLLHKQAELGAAEGKASLRRRGEPTPS